MAEALAYSLLKFGAAQTEKYALELDRGFQELAQYHRGLPKREHLTGKSQLRVHIVGSNYAVFANLGPDEAGVERIAILDFPGQRQDLPRILRDNALTFEREMAHLRASLSRKRLDGLLDQVKPENLHEEIDWGGPVGKEVW